MTIWTGPIPKKKKSANLIQPTQLRKIVTRRTEFERTRYPKAKRRVDLRRRVLRRNAKKWFKQIMLERGEITGREPLILSEFLEGIW
jgi:hypothetical protein